MGCFHYEELQGFSFLVFDEHSGVVGDKKDVTPEVFSWLAFQGNGHGAFDHDEVDVGITVVFGDFFSLRKHKVIDLHLVRIHDLLDAFLVGAFEVIESTSHGRFLLEVRIAHE